MFLFVVLSTFLAEKYSQKICWIVPHAPPPPPIGRGTVPNEVVIIWRWKITQKYLMRSLFNLGYCLSLFDGERKKISPVKVLLTTFYLASSPTFRSVNNLQKIASSSSPSPPSPSSVPVGSPSHGGDFTVYVWHKPTELAHSFSFCFCIYFCLYDPLNCVSFH